MRLVNYYKIIMKYIRLIVEIKPLNFPKLLNFHSSYKKYKSLTNTGELSALDLYPCISDDTPTTPFDAHYFYQGVWAFNRIKESGVKDHVDVGSEIRWVGLLSAIANVTFIDIRTFKIDIKNLVVKKGSLLEMPFESNSLDSLSCMHVAEHVGLGRYGDALDPDGTKKACKELTRILAIDGNLFFSLPVGKQKTCFNAHRIHSPQTIIDYFMGLKLIELSGVTDSGRFIENIDMDILENSNYACGLFRFKKEA